MQCQKHEETTFYFTQIKEPATRFAVISAPLKHFLE